MAMTMEAPSLLHDQRIELNGVSWELYQALLGIEESQRGGVRLLYDQGRLVLMSPSQRHESESEIISLLIRLTAAAYHRPILSLGRTTLMKRSALRAKEADNAFYLANEPLVRGREIDFEVDPPPDLAVEVVHSHLDPGMYNVYASLRVPELWLSVHGCIRVLRLQTSGEYKEGAASEALPEFPLAGLPRWLEKAYQEGESAMTRAYLDWIRQRPEDAKKAETS